MKALNVLFATAALTLTASFAQADVRPDEIPALLSSNAIMPFEKLNKIATDLHPGTTIRDTELDHHYGNYVYEVELTGANNIKWEVELDAKTGAVKKNHQDN